jgi:hypothetical protein
MMKFLARRSWHRIFVVIAALGLLGTMFASSTRASPCGPEPERRVAQVTVTPGVAPSPRVLNRLMRALGRMAKNRRAIARNGQPRGGKANLDRVHTEEYGEGSVSGLERDWGKMTEAERVFARELANEGFQVRLVPTRRDQRTSDFEVNGVTFELKTLQSFGKSTMRKRVKDAYWQNPDFIIINLRNVEATREAAEQQLRAAEKDLKVSLEGKVIVWMSDGTTWTY